LQQKGKKKKKKGEGDGFGGGCSFSNFWRKGLEGEGGESTGNQELVNIQKKGITTFVAPAPKKNCFSLGGSAEGGEGKNGIEGENKRSLGSWKAKRKKRARRCLPINSRS